MRHRLTIVEPRVAVVSAEVDAVSAPVWVPWPLPFGWTFAGLAHTDPSQRDGAASVTVWWGTDPFEEPIELLLVCEEAGSGVGSHFAGVATSYPGTEVGVGPPHARFTVGGRPVSLWAVEARSDRAVYAGEAAGRWLWAIVHPAEGSALVVEPLRLVDARLLGAELSTLPVRELSPRLLID